MFWFGRLPGELRIEREVFRFHFPIATMLLASVLIVLPVSALRRSL